MDTSIVIIGIAAVVVLAVVMVVATGRRQAKTGQLSRETRARDRSAASDASSASAGDAPGTDVDVMARERADEARAGAGGLTTRTSQTVAERVPVDEEELGETRRQFFNRGILMGLALAAGALGGAFLGFLWPSSAGGFGGKVNIGTTGEIDDTINSKKEPFYNAAARTYVVQYPKSALAKAKGLPSYTKLLPGLEQGYLALYQKCVHLGCRVPFCNTSQWFECPCHGSKYNRVGEKRGGPAPRGLDRFAFTISGGAMIVDTGVVITGPPIGTDTTGQSPEGAPCV